MIVVAIIGILAAVAIPGFMQYIKNSKTTEAKTNLKAIGDGALAFYQAEHYANQGMTAVTKQYPGVSGSVGIGTPASESTVGQKFSPSDVAGALGTQPWPALKFQITKPFYYYYIYAAESKIIDSHKCTDEEKAAPGGCQDTVAHYSEGDAPSKFQASATASLSGDKDSYFCINGDKEGVLSNIYEGDGTTCKPNEANASASLEGH